MLDRLSRTLNGILSMRKKWSRKSHLALRSIILNSEYSYQQEDAKKCCVIDLILAESLLTLYCPHNNVGKKNGEMMNRGIIFMEM